MHRTQLLLEEWQHAALKARAEREGRSISDLVREILSEHLSGRGKGLRLMEGVAGGGPSRSWARRTPV